jgi:tripartite-type tricarboxylate transporter receptor subunit TctC
MEYHGVPDVLDYPVSCHARKDSGLGSGRDASYSATAGPVTGLKELAMKVSWPCLRVAWLSLLVFSAASLLRAQAQPYPSKPVTIIADAAAGSTPDVVLRLIADRLGRIWGQQVVAVNHPGAGGSIAARIAADAPRDGYTLYMPVLSTFVALPGAVPNLPIRLPRDFVAIGFAAENPMFVAVTPALGVTTLSDLIARAKARPGEMSCAVTGIGRLTHLAAELLQSRADIKLLMVPYTGGPAHATSDVVSGRVSFIVEGYSGIAGAIQSGLIKAIAVASEQPLAEFPDLPTVAETIPGFSATGWQILVAPVGTPQAIIDKLSEDLRTVVTDPDLKQKIAVRGSYSRAMSPSETIAFVAAEQRKWTPVLEHIGKKPQ